MPFLAKFCRAAVVAAIFAAATSACAFAQQMTTPAQVEPAPDDANSGEGPVLQAAPLLPPELRGTEAPPLNDLSAEQQTAPELGDTNPVAAQPPNMAFRHLSARPATSSIMAAANRRSRGSINCRRSSGRARRCSRR